MKPLDLFLLSALINLGVGSQCTHNWTHFLDECYGYGEAAVSWANAQATCHFYQATLAEVPSLQVNNFLSEMAKNKSDYCVWLGGNDMFREGVWEWPSRPNTFKLFTKWASDEPNNMNDEDCLNMMKRHNYSWNDESCNSECNFICAAPAIDSHTIEERSESAHNY